ncbi:hypothetical protein [uncultured Sulfitobacter sp.]|jgi:hypothetical protein|uniref:hypothetical protein n=1 Tax=uncultured Sulfitobacter sp. TaxID=191468 RepID=UPI0032B1AF96|tara:strand:+ start:9854 stop:11713 length:1860 start_codon:yes stop_codon:yes gene_type:complete
MKHLFPTSKTQNATSAQAPTKMETLQDVRDYIAANGPAYLLAALDRLHSRALFGASLKTLKIADFDPTFPKSVRGIHPRPDLPQDLEAYKRTRSDCRRAIAFATGAAAEKQELRARQDGWADLLAAAKLHSTNGGSIHPNALSPLATFADIARRGGIEPWDLAAPGATDRIEDVLQAKTEREVVRRAQKTLNAFRYLPELGALLPTEPVPVQPSLRDLDALPAHVDEVAFAMIKKASTTRDRTTGKDAVRVGKRARDRYRAALRHHLRALPHCKPYHDPDPLIDYPSPLTDLNAVNDVEGLFSVDHLCASLRRTEEVEHLPGTLSQTSAYAYYNNILVVLGHNGLLDDETAEIIKSSEFYQQGKELANGMRPATARWCQNLIADPTKERRFRNLHRLMMRDAEKILADAKYREMTRIEIERVRALGTCAAASAIEWAGAPIRMVNCLGLRLHGSRQNFFTPGQKSSTYEFFLPKEETKAGEEVAPVELNADLHGPEVLDWYIETIRPLFPHADDSIYLFPAVESPGPLNKNTFDGWFQRASGSVGLHMTFHKWRHGYATILLDQNWANLKVAADMLGNTMSVCETNYTWINKKKLHKDGQRMMVERSHEKDAEVMGART